MSWLIGYDEPDDDDGLIEEQRELRENREMHEESYHGEHGTE